MRNVKASTGPESAIAAARRRRDEAKAIQQARIDRLTTELLDPSARSKDDDEVAASEGAASFFQRWSDHDLCLQLEGFVLGWLAATGQFDRYSQLAEIWLDTPKDLHTKIAVHSDIADPIARFNARLNLGEPKGQRGGN